MAAREGGEALWRDREPLPAERVVTRLRSHSARLLRGEVLVHGDGLHPRVVGVARIVDVAAIDGVRAPEVELHACLLLELAGDRLRARLPRVGHAARQGPPATVLALDDEDLERAGPRIVSRHDRIAREVGAPAAEEPAAREPRPPGGVARQAVGAVAH